MEKCENDKNNPIEFRNRLHIRCNFNNGVLNLRQLKFMEAYVDNGCELFRVDVEKHSILHDNSANNAVEVRKSAD